MIIVITIIATRAIIVVVIVLSARSEKRHAIHEPFEPISAGLPGGEALSLKNQLIAFSPAVTIIALVVVLVDGDACY